MSKILDNVTLVIPAKNEQEALPLFLEELDDYKVKILIVISKNDIVTYEKIKKKENIEILFQEHEGYGSAIIEAINKFLYFSRTINASCAEQTIPSQPDFFIRSACFKTIFSIFGSLSPSSIILSTCS